MDRAPEERLRKAEVELDDADFGRMGIESLVAHFREAGIREFEELVCRGDGAVVRVVVETRVDGDALAALDVVDRWGYTQGPDGEHVYRVEFTAPELPESLAGEMADLVGTCDPTLEDRGVTMSLVGTQDSIAGAIDEYETTGVRPDLLRLGEYEGSPDPLAALTDRQREVLRTAYELGHYEVPSEASTADVAAELDLDDSTVAEHLQRAERNLLARHFE